MTTGSYDTFLSSPTFKSVNLFIPRHKDGGYWKDKGKCFRRDVYQYQTKEQKDNFGLNAGLTTLKITIALVP